MGSTIQLTTDICGSFPSLVGWFNMIMIRTSSNTVMHLGYGFTTKFLLIHIYCYYECNRGTHKLAIKFKSQQNVAGFKLWNYNKSPEDAFRGAKLAKVFVDDTLLGNIEIRMAPGISGMGFAQTVLISKIRNLNKLTSDLNLFSNLKIDYIKSCSVGVNSRRCDQPYDMCLLPVGLSWTIIFYSNHGDAEHIALDAIELYDQHKNLICMKDACRSIRLISEMPVAQVYVRNMSPTENFNFYMQRQSLVPSTNQADNQTFLCVQILFNDVVALSKLRCVYTQFIMHSRMIP